VSVLNALLLGLNTDCCTRYSTTSDAKSPVAISERCVTTRSGKAELDKSNRGRCVNTPPSSSSPHQVIPDTDTEVDDDALVQQYDVGDGIGQEIFGALGTGGLEEIGEDEDEDEGADDFAQDGKCHSFSSTFCSEPCIDVFKKFQTKTRVSAAERWEANRRAGWSKDSEIGCEVLEGKA